MSKRKPAEPTERPEWPIVLTKDGYVIYDPADGYHLGQGGIMRRIVDGRWVYTTETTP